MVHIISGDMCRLLRHIVSHADSMHTGKRLTPGPGYLEACIEDNVNYISTGIKRIHPDGIEDNDGKLRKVDIIICATGFDV